MPKTPTVEAAENIKDVGIHPVGGMKETYPGREGASGNHSNGWCGNETALYLRESFEASDLNNF